MLNFSASFASLGTFWINPNFCNGELLPQTLKAGEGQKQHFPEQSTIVDQRPDCPDP
jgi:hypothetical protein